MVTGADNATLDGVTISGGSTDGFNVPNYVGGGMLNMNSSPTLTNVTISGNRNEYEGSGGGMFNFMSIPTIRNSIIWSNNGGEIAGDAANVSYSIVQGGYPGATAADPLFVNPISAASALITAGDYRLQAASPAMNAGDNTLIPDGVTTERDGGPRIIGGTVDIGTYEVQFPSAVSIARAGANPTQADSVAFTVTFNTPVTGVDAGDFTLAIGGTIAEAGITSVTGSGTVWTVNIATGHGRGTIGLNLVDDNSIRALTNIPLGSDGPANGDFAGAVYSIDRSYTIMLPLIMTWDSAPNLAVSAIRAGSNGLGINIAKPGNAPVSNASSTQPIPAQPMARRWKSMSAMAGHTIISVRRT